MIINQTAAYAEGTGEFRVRFIDFDGRVIRTCRVSSGGAAASPIAPAHEGLTFQGWNISPQRLSNIKRDIDAGAVYTTSDGKTRLYLRITPLTGLSTAIYLSKSDDSVLRIDWGDASSETISTSGALSVSHTYAAAGDYTVALSVESGSGTYTIGDGSVAVVGGSTQSIKNTLTGVHIGAGVSGIGNLGLSGCQSLRYITMPESLETIGNAAFYCCYSLSCAVIPEGISTLGNSVFYNCRTLYAVSIPESVNALGTAVLLGCLSLDSFSVPPLTALSDQTLMSCTMLKSVNIPQSAGSIGSSTFYNCYNLKSLTVPKGVASIGANAFSGCGSLLKYVFESEVPPTLASTNVFSGINVICRIYVPDASVSSYKTASYWSAYADFIFSMSELKE